MNSIRRIAVLGFVGMLCGLSAANIHAQRYPTKPIRAIVAWPPGGGTDTMARLIMPHLEEQLGERIVIDNRPGGRGYIGAELAAKATPDGYTLFFADANLVMSLSLFPKLRFDPLKDFVPVALLLKEPSVLTVHPSLPVNSVKDLIALAKTHPGKLNYAGGLGSSMHLNSELFKMMAKVDIVHVPYNGAGPAILGTMIGEAQVVLAPISAALPHVKSGKLRALAITLGERTKELPDLPAMVEFLPGFAAFQWYGVVAPTGTSDVIINKLNNVLVKIMQIPDLRARLVRDGSVPVGSTPQEFGVHIRDEKVKWANVVKVSGVRIE